MSKKYTNKDKVSQKRYHDNVRSIYHLYRNNQILTRPQYQDVISKLNKYKRIAKKYKHAYYNLLHINHHYSNHYSYHYNHNYHYHKSYNNHQNIPTTNSTNSTPNYRHNRLNADASNFDARTDTGKTVIWVIEKHNQITKNKWDALIKYISKNISKFGHREWTTLTAYLNYYSPINKDKVNKLNGTYRKYYHRHILNHARYMLKHRDKYTANDWTKVTKYINKHCNVSNKTLIKMMKAMIKAKNKEDQKSPDATNNKISTPTHPNQEMQDYLSNF